MIAVIVASIALIPFFFRYAHLRIWESCVAFGNSFKYYISELLGLELHGEITVNDFTQQPFNLPLNLPRTWGEFTTNISGYWGLFFSMENFSAYMGKVADVLFYITKIILIVMPVFLIGFIVSIFLPKKQNNDYAKESKALQRFKRFEIRVCKPVSVWVKEFIGFVRDNGYYLKIIAWIWAYSFNVIAIVISFFAYYLYFISALKTATIYIQLCKLLMDVSVVPAFLWCVLGFVLFLKLRRAIGYSRLEHMEMKDRGFINESPIVLMLCGTMGSKKTTIVTDMTLSTEIMFRDKAYEKILDCDLKFPYFPWINLERDIKHAIDVHYVYNLATCKVFIRSLRRRFRRKRGGYIFGYDYKRYGMEYNDGLAVQDIWEVLESYAQLYFIYVIESSLIISNYSIRTDNIIDDIGNFPLWDTDLFRRDSRYIDAYSRHAHVLDFDALRLGKKLIENNKYKDFFEFGIIDITEIGKERGNMLELQNIKKNDGNCNQKNDGFNDWLKLIRHSATVDNYPFVRVLTDDQRPESWGADARQLTDIIHSAECSELRLSMPFFFVEDLIVNLLYNGFVKRYRKYRYDRGDYTLPMYLYHGIISKLYRYQKRVYNTFGYMKVNAEVEAGTQDGKIKQHLYYLMPKKIYSKRFSTDCFCDFFDEKALRSAVGLNDIDEFKSEKATFNELMQENSYFFNSLDKMLK